MMNMKKMRGVIDPITLGFIIAAGITLFGIQASNTTPQTAQNQVQSAAMHQQPQVTHTQAILKKAGQ
ncbi:hypothetical protein [uncultured Thiothrix sp.]|uniref:hypothetical protein n=1 Tax=uncultured Thiothrix sp. TaxID=223185 RepID=UPI002639458E|nr:hypothetical protein [uncultured Thiothrix sp.]HMT93207.1 hypothetical protein [Thiolinea sp.]